ncbi:MAG: hypothetical protein M2R46_02669 [Verrucomicrobia subdivision 3 bacterium]|nr:hypothetical protein [Limisphaerales bacterium]
MSADIAEQMKRTLGALFRQSPRGNTGAPAKARQETGSRSKQPVLSKGIAPWYFGRLKG